MNQTSFEQVILAGVRNLPPERQREVADFVYFLRQREAGGAEYESLLKADLAALEVDELKHLDEEFKDYEQLYPRR
jgi:hypothetical protein